MSAEHQRRALEWWLYLHSEHLDSTKVLTDHQQQSLKALRRSLTEPALGPVLYDTGLDATGGLWIRTGWAGRG